MKNKFDSFDDWFNQLESYHLLSERFYEEYENMDVNRIVDWLRAAFEAAREKQ